MSTESSNIHRFNQAVAEIFSLLYQSFPIRRRINIRSHLGYSVENDHPYGEEPEDVQLYNETLIWLRESGYIRYTADSPTDVVLFAKGLEALKLVPDVLDSSEPIGSRLVKAVKSGATETSKEIIHKLLAVALGALFK